MKLYLVRRTDAVDYDEYDEAVVRAKDTDQAAAVAARHLIGMTRYNTKVTEVTAEQERLSRADAARTTLRVRVVPDCNFCTKMFLRSVHVAMRPFADGRTCSRRRSACRRQGCWSRARATRSPRPHPRCIPSWYGRCCCCCYCCWYGRCCCCYCCCRFRPITPLCMH